MITKETFFIGGKPHQIVQTKVSLKYDVVEIQSVPENWKSWAKGMVRVRLHTGSIESCLQFLLELINEKGIPADREGWWAL